ncbi:unnamed protein product [Parnassius mnemosyne]|uniref:Reverse transcriptase domain-containing protein n=1 Tax=Parnassius mnemosyne TaxID=213953 RepID=A0AAV1M2X6_9NEOP
MRTISKSFSKGDQERRSEYAGILFERDDCKDESNSNISLTQKIKNNTLNPSIPICDPSSGTHRKKYDLFGKVEDKIHDGDLKGATRLLFSNDTLAPDTPETKAALQSKHPPGPSTPIFVDPPSDPPGCLHATVRDVLTALASFPKGSASGLDGISPQHLIDLTSYGSGVAGEQLTTSLTKLVNLMLMGDVCPDVTPLIYGANLIALTKKDGGVRPIAVGSTFRRLAAKICVRLTRTKLQALFEPVQVGFGTRGGCEAAVHAVRTFLKSDSCEVLLKLDLKNAFNSVNRDTLLKEIKIHVPEIYNFLLQCYHCPSKLVHKSNEIISAVGCQQGDPLGPAIFSLAINPIIHSLNSKLNIWYLDDGTLAGDAQTVLADLVHVKQHFNRIGLELNYDKSELYISDKVNPLTASQIAQNFNNIALNIKIVTKDSLHLLGSPIFEEAIPLLLNKSTTNFSNTLDLAGRILKAPAGINCKIACLDEATNAWLAGPSPNLPSKPHKQRAWDTIASVATLQTLIEPSTGRGRARLLAVSKPESGYWLQAYPSPNTGTFINPDTLRIAVGLRLGAGICTGHNCVSCGAPVDRLGHHGLSCTSGAGRLSRHAALNDILRRALVSANVPAALEPQIVRSDGKRPDGIIIPWKSGRALVWDATCTDTLAASYLPATTKRAGAAADARERLKVSKYSFLGAQYQFFAFGVETLGPWGKGALELHRELSKRLREATGDPRAGGFLAQRIAIAVQRGNAACVMGTLPRGPGLLFN